ncbi:PilW family protein [Candidatus Omnitrophota bacterium]
MRSLRHNKTSGFSLMEILVASAILALVMGALSSIYISGLDVWESGTNQADLQAQARAALNYMVAELRNATRTSSQNPSPNLSIPSVPNNKQIHFYLPGDKDDDGFLTDANGDIEWVTNSQIHYQYIPGQKMLRRSVGGNHRIFATDVSDVEFEDITVDPTLALNELRIILTISKTTKKQKTAEITVSSIVALRN